MNRRDLLKTMGAAAGAASLGRLLPGCGSGPGTIDTFIYLMMENRSYDHWFGARSMLEGLPGDGLSMTMANLDTDNTPVFPWQATNDKMCVPDPSHGWEASHIQFNGGLNDGFVTTDQADHPGDLGAMQYVTRRHIPVTWALADNYSSFDRWYASVMGSTWPNRFYWIAATSMGQQGNSIPAGGFTAPTIFQRLQEAKVDWAIYYADLPFVAILGSGFTKNVVEEGHVRGLNDFYDDARRGKLPTFCYLDPPFTFGDNHPPHHPIRGEEYLTSIYNTLAKAPQWERLLWITTYDEHGGFFDHVPPPKTDDDDIDLGFDQLGFRVPAMAVGPYVKQGYVSSVQHDHGSGHKHLQNALGLARLTRRSDAANDFSDIIDTLRLEAGHPSEPIELPTVNVDEWTIGAECMASTFKEGRPESTDDLARWFDEHPELAHLDRRDHLPEIQRAIAEAAACR